MKFKELLYKREIEIFWDASTKETYGIREVWRSRCCDPLGWRNYSSKKGNRITLSMKQMQSLLKEAQGFVRFRN